MVKSLPANNIEKSGQIVFDVAVVAGVFSIGVGLFVDHAIAWLVSPTT